MVDTSRLALNEARIEFLLEKVDEHENLLEIYSQNLADAYIEREAILSGEE